MDAVAVPELRCLHGREDQHARCPCIVCAYVGPLPSPDAADLDLDVFDADVILAVFDLVAADAGRPSRLRGTHTHGLGIRHGLGIWHGPVSDPATSCDSDEEDDDGGVGVAADLPAGYKPVVKMVAKETAKELAVGAIDNK